MVTGWIRTLLNNSKSEGNTLKFTLHRDFPESLKTEWNTLLSQGVSHVPFLRYEYLNTWWHTRGGGEWPQAELAIISAEEDGKLIGIAPFFLADHEGKRRLLFLGSIEISDFLDLIVRDDDAARFSTELVSFLLNTEELSWQAVDLYNILERSVSLKSLEDAANQAGLVFDASRLQHSPYIPLPADWDSYLAGIDKKQRHEIRRKLRRAEEAGEAVDWYIVENRDSLTAETDAFIALMANDEDKRKFLSSPMCEHIHSTVNCAFEEGCLQLAFMEVNGEKAAAYLSFDYLGRIWVYNSGLDYKFAEFSPGWVLLANLIRLAIEQGRSEFDFMRGNEDYKYRFGAVDRYVKRAVITRD
jgi:CelD/BcsL family acetyltransferase involved in cellulose biosynthesis